jgi:hypothetical protein
LRETFFDQIMYRLEKYKGKSTRHTCPNCGTNHAFSRYVDVSGNYLDDSVGKCDRDSKCGFHCTPKQYFADRPRIFEQYKPRALKQEAVTPIVETRKIDFIDYEVLLNSLGNYDRNSFVRFLFGLFPDDPEAVRQSVSRYFLGTSEEKVVFWQVDRRRRIRTGKLMLYDPATGKRIAETFAGTNGETVEIKTNWIHAQLKRRGLLKTDFNLKQCFFGEHLTATEADSPVAIVEAEKTAVIASICYPEFVWLATGGKQNLSAEKLQRFGDRKIILYPDGDGFERWQEIARQTCARGVTVNTSLLIEQRATAEQKASGCDLADFLIIEQNKINTFNRLADKYNAAVNTILNDPELQSQFFTLLDERKAILMIDGQMSESEAETRVTDPENIRNIVLSL